MKFYYAEPTGLHAIGHAMGSVSAWESGSRGVYEPSPGGPPPAVWWALASVDASRVHLVGVEPQGVWGLVAVCGSWQDALVLLGAAPSLYRAARRASPGENIEVREPIVH